MSYRCAQSFEFFCLFTLIALVILSKIIRYYLYADDFKFCIFSSAFSPELKSYIQLPSGISTWKPNRHFRVNETNLVFFALLIFPNLSVFFALLIFPNLSVEFILGSSLPLTYNLVADSTSNTFYIYIDRNHQFLLRLTKRLLTDLLHSVLVFYGLFSIHQSERYLEKAVSSWHWSAQTLPWLSIPLK